MKYQRLINTLCTIKVLSGEWYVLYLKNTSLKKDCNISPTKRGLNEFPVISGSTHDKHSLDASLNVVGGDEEIF